MRIATLAIGALYIGSTILTPLYPIYQREFGISPLNVTVIYAVYVVGNLAVLFFFGRLSDQVGRRLSALISFGLTLASAVIFLLAGSMTVLMAARAINGFAAGLGAATLTAWIAELEPHKDRSRAAVIASAGNLGGLAAGAIVAGLLAEYVAAPLRTVFVVYIVALIVVFLLLFRINDTVQVKTKRFADLDLTPRIGVPADIRLTFVAPACMAFAAFALGGFFSALVPELVTRELQQSSVALVGGIVSIFFASACLTAALTRRLQSWTAMFAGAGCVFPAVALLIYAEHLRSLAWLIAAAIIAGAAMALSYRGSLQVLNEIAPQEQRAEVVSSYLLMCYLGNSVPVLGVGLLATAVSQPTAHAIFAAVVAGLAIAAIVVGTTNIEKGRTANQCKC